jgi:hypothetical protein
MKTHSFNGRRYEIDTTPLAGLCNKKSTSIRIFEDLNTRKGLITAIHETLHAEAWNTSEKVIDRVSTEIGDFLWRLGYRHNGTDTKRA